MPNYFTTVCVHVERLFLPLYMARILQTVRCHKNASRRDEFSHKFPEIWRIT